MGFVALHWKDADKLRHDFRTYVVSAVWGCDSMTVYVLFYDSYSCEQYRRVINKINTIYSK